MAKTKYEELIKMTPYIEKSVNYVSLAELIPFLKSFMNSYYDSFDCDMHGIRMEPIIVTLCDSFNGLAITLYWSEELDDINEAILKSCPWRIDIMLKRVDIFLDLSMLMKSGTENWRK